MARSTAASRRLLLRSVRLWRVAVHGLQLRSSTMSRIFISGSSTGLGLMAADLLGGAADAAGRAGDEDRLSGEIIRRLRHRWLLVPLSVPGRPIVPARRACDNRRPIDVSFGGERRQCREYRSNTATRVRRSAPYSSTS